jgi:diaminohydroxyphosphoribosylaminopyrimidine deaminase/5-amino-6-(5-phosphoribosylamino)uracil reductase
LESFQKTSDNETRTGRISWSDEAYMQRALELSWQAAGLTHPNPLVGAVVVNRGEVVGEGYHKRCGQAHAEVIALDRAGERSRGSTLYVTLEPCAHHGRTPPCTDRIIAAGVKRVVFPTVDPDEKVRGAGIRRLRDAGIVVDAGCLETAAITVNLAFYKDRLGMGPAVVLKMAATMDGKIASRPGKRDRITGGEALRYAHQLRAASEGVVVGIGTVRADDPGLDCRLADCAGQPAPVVMDSHCSLSPDNRWAAGDRKFYVAGLEGADPAKMDGIRAAGGSVLTCGSAPGGRVDPADAVDRLAAAGITRLLVEGGSQVFTGFLRSGRWDAMYLFQSPLVFGAGAVSVVAGGLSVDALAVDTIRLGNDFLFRYLNRPVAGEILEKLKPVSEGQACLPE